MCGGESVFGTIGELLPIHKRLSGPLYCLPASRATGDATLARFSAISWRIREFFAGGISDFISVFLIRRTCLLSMKMNSLRKLPMPAMEVEWDGDSISEELIHGADNMSALSWMSHGHDRRGVAERIQVGVYFWLALHRIRIPPFYLRSSRNISSGFLTRTTDAEITQWASVQMMKRIRLWASREEFVQLTASLQKNPNIRPSCPVHYRGLPALKSIFAEFNPMIFTMCQFTQELCMRSQRIDDFHSTIGKLASNAGSLEYVDGPIFSLDR